MTSKYLIAVVLLSLIILFCLQSCVSGANNVDISNDSGLLWLVNRENMLPANFKPVELSEYQGIKLHAAAKEPFSKLLKAMQAEGIHGLRLQSAYRTFSYQTAVFNQRVKEFTARGYSKDEAEEAASKSVQPPGASEHQLGLALDVSLDGTLTQAFGETRAGKWLEEHSHKYGFIIRYPEDKTDITQIVYEPWHLRYVGIPHSSIMKNLELTLEEYLSYIKETQTYICWGEGGEYYLITYSESRPTVLPHEVINVSSLNANSGYIITMRKVYKNTGTWR